MAYQPKSYRKFLATSLSAVVAVSAAAPLAASAATTSFTDVPADAWYGVSLSNLVDAGIIGGVGNGKFDPTGEVTRTQLAKMLVYATGLNENEAVADPGFSDVKTSDWFYKDVAVAKAHGILNGVATDKFGVDSTLTRDQMATAIVNAFNLRGSVDTSSVTLPYTDLNGSVYTNDIKVLYGLGVLQNTTKYNPSTTVDRQTFVAFLDKTMTAVANLSPAIVNVTAVNAKEVQIKFNKPVKEASVISSGNLKAGVFKINNVEANTLTSDASLSADGKTLTLTASGTWSGSYSIELLANQAETLSGTKVAAYQSFFKASDTTRPSITGVTYVDKYTYNVNFSEPALTATPTFKYADGTALATAPTVTFTPGTSFAHVVFAADTAVNKGIVVSFADLTDYAGNVSVPTSTNITISDADQVKPSVVSVATTGFDGTNTSFKIQLSEAVKGTTVSGITVNGALVSATVDSKDNTVLDATVAGQLKGSALVYIPANAFTDLNNNGNAEVGQFFTFTQDETKPAVTSQSVQRISGVEYLVLTFGEDVTLSTLPTSLDFHYTDQYGMDQKVTVASPSVTAVSGSTNQVKVSLASLSDNTTYKVSFASDLVKDNYNNSSDAINDVTFSTSTVNTGVGTTNAVDIGTTPATPGQVTVTFSKAVNVASAENVANYVVEGATIKSADVTANGTLGATVVLTLNDGTVENTGWYNVTVKPIQAFSSLDSSNAETTASVNLKENVRSVLSSQVITNLAANDLSVKLTFNDASLVNDSKADFELYVDGKATGQTVNAGVFSNGVGTVTWTDSTSTVADLTTATSIKLVPVSTLDIHDTAGNVVNVSDIVIK